MFLLLTILIKNGVFLALYNKVRNRKLLTKNKLGGFYSLQVILTSCILIVCLSSKHFKNKKLHNIMHKKNIGDIQISLKKWDNKVVVKNKKDGNIIKEIEFSDYVKASIAFNLIK